MSFQLSMVDMPGTGADEIRVGAEADLGGGGGRLELARGGGGGAAGFCSQLERDACIAGVRGARDGGVGVARWRRQGRVDGGGWRWVGDALLLTALHGKRLGIVQTGGMQPHPLGKPLARDAALDEG